MAYFQIGILTVVGLVVFGIFLGYLIDLNKDATFQNRRQKRMRPPLEVVRKRRVQKERERGGKPERGPRGPEKRR